MRFASQSFGSINTWKLKRVPLFPRTMVFVLCVSLCAAGWPSAQAQQDVTKSSSFEYDPATGLLTKETIEPGNPDLEVVTIRGYDTFGNVTSVTVAHGASVVDPLKKIETRTSTSSFIDPNGVDGQFPVSSTNALSQTISGTFDARFGAGKTSTDLNGLVSEVDYDEFGRVEREEAPDGTYTTYSYDYCTGIAGGSATCPENAAYVITSQGYDNTGQPLGPYTKAYNDRLGREVASETKGFDGSPIRVSTEYDSWGRTTRESRPYFFDASLPDNGALHWTQYEVFDILGRVELVRLPDGSEAKSRYMGLRTEVENDLDQVTATIKNERGETIEVIDHLLNSTTYTFDAAGNMTSISDAVGNVSVTVYDKAGNKLTSHDPDMGTWTYVTDVLGQVRQQTDAKGQTATVTYDKLGRPVQRTEVDGSSVWVYDSLAGENTGKSVGQLVKTERFDGAGALVHQQKLVFESTLGRPFQSSSKTGTADEETFTVSYDAKSSRIDRTWYPSGFVTQAVYNAQGYQSELRENSATGRLLWQANELDAELRVVRETAGNGIKSWRDYNVAQGTVHNIRAGTNFIDATVADFYYQFDTIGNLVGRNDNIADGTWQQNFGLYETFLYDDLNRLESYSHCIGNSCTPQAGDTTTVTYDDAGNILNKSDVGDYKYGYDIDNSHGQVRPHALTQVSGTLNQSYGYDANGNMFYGAGRTITWSSFNKVSTIVDGNNTIDFTYGADRQRVRMQTGDGATFYHAAFGVMAELFVETGTNGEKWSNYLYAGGQMVGVHIEDDTGQAFAEATSWFITDHLGSVAIVMDETGAVTERLSYDAWGKRRYVDGTPDDLGALTSNVTTRGFTGHEMIDDTDLVNMNGRIYDPTIGRFLSADPIIPDLTISQALNRYTYVINNPLSYTDPSGHIFETIVAAIAWLGGGSVAVGTVVATTLAIIATQDFALAASLLLSVALPGWLALDPGYFVYGISGGISSVVATGDPSSFLTGFAQAFVAHGIGNFFGDVVTSSGVDIGNEVARAAAHGVSGGVFAEINGGDFAAGFLAGGFSSASSTFIQARGFEGLSGLAAAAIAGGAGSAIGGGKFADGALTGAFTWAYNFGEQGRSETEPEYTTMGLDDALALFKTPVYTWGDFFWDGVTVAGGIFDILTIPSGEGVVIAAGAQGAKIAGRSRHYTRFKSITGKRSIRNLRINVDIKEFQQNIVANGFRVEKTIPTARGVVTNYSRGSTRYSVRNFSSSTKGPSVDVFINGEKVSKLRLNK